MAGTRGGDGPTSAQDLLGVMEVEAVDVGPQKADRFEVWGT